MGIDSVSDKCGIQGKVYGGCSARRDGLFIIVCLLLRVDQNCFCYVFSGVNLDHYFQNIKCFVNVINLFG